VPLLVGGTMLYFKILRDGIAALPAADPQVRAELAAEAERSGWPALHQQLAAVDPVAAARIHPHHSQRIQRALEVYRLSGQPLSTLQQAGAVIEPSTHRLVPLAVAPAERAVLHERIAERFAAMLAQGFVEEVAALHGRGDLHLDLPSMRAVGYRQVWSYLDGDIDSSALLERGVIATRQLANRQFTWLRQWPGLQWLLTDAEQRLAVAGPLPAGAPVAAAALKYLREIAI
jgi:tRNA dimethylallyltransferase